jgi:tRNA-2-methylthio-N6-dimethylallyladenosine synthase
MTLMAETFYIKTFGCQMNEADTERMATHLGEMGLKPSKRLEDADVILVNGCSVREKAVHKALSALGTFKDLKKREKPAVIGVGGCVGQLEKDKLFKQAPFVDFVFGPDRIDSLPELLFRVKAGERRVQATDFDAVREFVTDTNPERPAKARFVNIMKGCDKFCTYCIVPFTRGREKSRTIHAVLEDIERLCASGVEEVTLLGQNVNSFGKGNPNLLGLHPRKLSGIIGKVGPAEGDENFPQLLHALEEGTAFSALKRIRFTSSHPLDFSEELLDAYVGEKGPLVTKLARHLHLPVQSGSDSCLRRMGRHHKISAYLSQMLKLREKAPDVALSTDLIVGFPGETQEEFKATLELLKLIRYDQVYAFAYSVRPGTRAAKFEDDIPLQLKKERLAEVLQLQSGIQRENFAAFVGREVELLVESDSKVQRLQGQGAGRSWLGRTSCNRVVNFFAPTLRDLTGHWVQVRIRESSALALKGDWLIESDLAC